MNYAKKISSPIGDLYLIANDHALIALDNVSNDQYKKAVQSKTHKILNLTHKQLDEYFMGKRIEFDLPLEAIGTPFQQKSWKALMKIPFGSVWSYGEQAKFLKSPKACRAVGGANGKNPIPIIIPCHRVIGSTGKLTGYSGGMKMKIGLLKHEGHQIDGLQLIES
ncbi:MAG: methylated-DNA--[protein]-cysteine S-methyltransferase [Bacteriovorax sp.]|nr:methylated-DNA--[protein]-cysteine S-methyltransferase [Bacteriovorax sp.]